MYGDSAKSYVVISYRDEGNGKGAFYDHYTMQRITDHETVIAVASSMDLSAITLYVNSETKVLSFGVSDADSPLRKIPPAINDNSIYGDNAGLLLIPGRARATEKDRPTAHRNRSEFENDLIKKALLKGQPILALCAGAWQLWEIKGGYLVKVQSHCYRGGMPRITNSIKQKGKIVSNKQVHRIKIKNHTMLYGAMLGGEWSEYTSAWIGALSVNSVHWMAPYTVCQPDQYEICAKSVRDDSIAPSNMQVAENSVEAFESMFGAPVLGVQWHPEAYNADDESSWHPKRHRDIVKYMVQAGDAYSAKQKMLREFKLDENTAALLSRSGMFSVPSKEQQASSEEVSQITGSVADLRL